MLQHITYPSHFLIGLPGSGKSTLAAWLHRHTGATLISTDQIRAELYGDPEIQGDWCAIEQQVLRQMQQAIAQRQTIIYDATNCYQPWRADLLQKCPAIAWVAWWLQSPVDLCLARNQRRSRQVPSEIILKMAQDLATQPPDPSEGFIEVIRLPNTDATTLRALQKLHPEYLGG